MNEMLDVNFLEVFSSPDHVLKALLEKKKKKFFLTCIHEHVSAAIIESYEITNFCRIAKTFLRRACEISLT